MSERGQRGWAVLAATVPMFTISMTQMAMHRTDLAEMWPVWRPMLLDLTLVVAGATLVAALAVGIAAWRQARASGHA